MKYATLSNDSQYTIFKFNDIVIRFCSPYSLEYYTDIKEWDKGYLVVMAKYRHNNEVEEEYIDMASILKNLYFDADAFLKHIKGVKLQYD